jgi:hypothetical protein
MLGIEAIGFLTSSARAIARAELKGIVRLSSIRPGCRKNAFILKFTESFSGALSGPLSGPLTSRSILTSSGGPGEVDLLKRW